MEFCYLKIRNMYVNLYLSFLFVRIDNDIFFRNILLKSQGVEASRLNTVPAVPEDYLLYCI